MKKYSAKKKRRTCKKGGTTPVKIDVRFVNKPIQQLVPGKKYALIYDFKGKTITQFFNDNDTVGTINTAYKTANEIPGCENVKLIEYKYISKYISI